MRTLKKRGASNAEAVKSKAKAEGISYTRYVRMLMERDVARR